MRATHLFRALSALSALCLLTAVLCACGGQALYTETVGDMTFTLYGGERAERLTVTRDGDKIFSVRKRGVPGSVSGESFGLTLCDLDFDGDTDIRYLTGVTENALHYSCYLWDGETFVLHRELSKLDNLEADDHARELSSFETVLTVDPATTDTPAFDILLKRMTRYRWEDGNPVAFHRVELTFYEESDIYCYAIYDLNENGEWDTTRESWITAERFVEEHYPLN